MRRVEFATVFSANVFIKLFIDVGNKFAETALAAFFGTKLGPV